MPSANSDSALVLEDTARPATEPIERRHAPIGKYATFKPCIRWDFGFSCAICLVHEAELTEHGARGSGLTSIEHRELRSTTPTGIDAYDNCLFVCRFCNGTRTIKPLKDKLGRTLLDPTVVAWADHFAFQGTALEVISGNPDADYTSEAYGINKARTLAMRDNRRQALLGAFRVLARRPQLVELVSKGDHADLVELFRETIRAAELTIIRFFAVPSDAPRGCACDAHAACCLSAAVRQRGRTAAP